MARDDFELRDVVALFDQELWQNGHKEYNPNGQAAP